MCRVPYTNRPTRRPPSDILRDRSGAVLPFVTVLLVVIIGFALLAIDGSRYINLQSQLQKGADAIAIAAAAELDGRADAIVRATRAANELVDNGHVWGDGAQQRIEQWGLRFLDELPGDDALPITEAFVTAEPQEARFVEVTVEPQQLSALMPAAFIGGATQVTAGAQAVAGFTQAVCDFTPLFICNPFENESPGLFEAMENYEVRRRMIEMRQVGGQDAHWGPGNYGFLATHEGNKSARALAEMLASANPPACFSQDGVEMRPGNPNQPTSSALNVRFDIYTQPHFGNQQARNNPDFRPATNVRKGWKTTTQGQNCAYDDAPEPPEHWMGLPRDDCLYDDDCPYMGGRMGTGDWNFADYWQTNHDSASYPSDWDLDLPTRYDVYRYEIEQGLVANPSQGGETGAPICAATATEQGVDRRLLYAAIINCQEYEDQLKGASGGKVPVEAFASFFLTEPVGGGSHATIRAEVAGLIEPGDDTGVLHDIVQLYR